ncbi:glucosamine-6-phosphate deaminase [Candidatus Bipolaricaulota sp. J31]
MLKLFVFENYEILCREAARRVARILISNPRAVLALPTGETPKGFYRTLVAWCEEGIIDLSGTTVFNLDEYLGIPKEHPCSFHSYMDNHLLRYTRVGRHFIPNPLAPDPEGECRRYEKAIAEAGGIDLAVLGLGLNGHIAFNEPGTPFETLTHVAELSPETREREAKAFGGIRAVPKKAITMGIRTIMNARAVILMAAGEKKAGIVRRSFQGPVAPDAPASVLQLHPNATVLLDRAAASELSPDEIQVTVGGLV